MPRKKAASTKAQDDAPKVPGQRTTRQTKAKEKAEIEKLRSSLRVAQIENNMAKTQASLIATALTPRVVPTSSAPKRRKSLEREGALADVSQAKAAGYQSVS